MMTISVFILDNFYGFLLGFLPSEERLLEQYAVIPTIDGHKLPFYAVLPVLSIPFRIGKMAIKMTQNQLF